MLIKRGLILEPEVETDQWWLSGKAELLVLESSTWEAMIIMIGASD